MANEPVPQHDTVGAWAKRYYFAQRATMESVLRPYDLGSTQWYVLWQLVNVGPTMQRDLVQLLHIERATLSGVVSTLVRKGLVSQAADAADQRQRMLSITPAGEALWAKLPDPVPVIMDVAYSEQDDAELALALRVLKAATLRLEEHAAGE